MGFYFPGDGYTQLGDCPSACKSNLKGIQAFIPIQKSKVHFPLNLTGFRMFIADRGPGTMNSNGNGKYRVMGSSNGSS